MLFCCSGNKTIKIDHKIHIFKLTCNFLFIMSTINKHGRDWKQGLIEIPQYLEILILIQKYLALRKFLVVKERESLNILWEIAVDTLTKGFDRWELINSFFFFLQQTRIFLWSLFGSNTQLLLFSRRNFREIRWKSSDHTPFLWALLALLLLRKRVTSSSLTTTNPSAVIFSRTTNNLSLISKLGKGENPDFATRYDNWCYTRRIWHLVLGSSCHIDSTTVLIESMQVKRFWRTVTTSRALTWCTPRLNN